MAVSGFLFLSWRVLEVITLTPIVGMLGWFVHVYDKNNWLTPGYILVLFIVSVLALAWTVLTTVGYRRARRDAGFVAFVDLLVVGALVGGVVVLRFIGDASCADWRVGNRYLSVSVDKQCAMLKASWALAIIDIIAFVVTWLLALLVHRHHRDDGAVVVKRAYHSSRHGHRRPGSRARSRDYRAGRSSTRRSSSRRQYYV